MLATKHALLASSEDAILSELGAWTQGILRKKQLVEADEDEDEDKDKDKDKKP